MPRVFLSQRPCNNFLGFFLNNKCNTYFLLVLLQITLATKLQNDIPNPILSELVNKPNDIFMVERLHQFDLFLGHISVLNNYKHTAFFIFFIFLIATFSLVLMF